MAQHFLFPINFAFPYWTLKRIFGASRKQWNVVRLFFRLLPSATKLRRLCFYTCLSVHRGVCLSACWNTTTTPREQTPTSLGADTPLGADAPLQSRHPPRADTPEQTSSGSRHPPGADTHPEQTPPRSRHPLWEQTHPWEQTPPSPISRRLLLRTARILLECILVVQRSTMYTPKAKIHLWIRQTVKVCLYIIVKGHAFWKILICSVH